MKYLYKVVTWDDKSLFAQGRYQLDFKNGEVVEAPPGTIGIFCFEKKGEAVNCLRYKMCNKKDARIKKLIPLAYPKVQLRSSVHCTQSLLDSFYDGTLKGCTDYVLTCDKVKVVSECKFSLFQFNKSRVRYKVVTKDYKSYVAKGTYCLTYTPNSVVKSMNGTLGIFCYKTRKEAEHLIRFGPHLNSQRSNYRIIRVEVSGKNNKFKYYGATATEKDLLNFYMRLDGEGTEGLLFQRSGWDNSECYPSVKVIG